MNDGGREFGTISRTALERVRNTWIDLEPLVAETAYDDVVDPSELRISLEDGIGEAAAARIDVQWSRCGNYSFHYADVGIDWRFDRHPNPHSPEKHFHPPPDASGAEPSCIRIEEVTLVTRAVHSLWRRTYERGDVSDLNAGSNPP